MSPYTILNSVVGTNDAAALSARLSVWHDAMVAHERRLEAGTGDACHDECPHAEARTLWADALAMFGARAHKLTFLRSRAHGAHAQARAAGTAGTTSATVGVDSR